MNISPAASTGPHQTRPSRRPGSVAPLLRGVVCTLWAGVMLVLGIATLVDGAGPVPVPRATFWFLGAAAVAGGQFVFMVLVADRFFAHAARAVVSGLETLAFLIFLGGTIAALVSFGTGV